MRRRYRVRKMRVTWESFFTAGTYALGTFLLSNALHVWVLLTGGRGVPEPFYCRSKPILSVFYCWF